MTRILRDKFRSLLYGDDGAALVITLAVFFLLYLLCMGALAVGTAVKERIQLQNACDAAAYSAAVVQADTLSRIATLNRAMSWTYVQMTRRQMDYIVARWLEHTASHYNTDRTAALAWYLSSTPTPPCPLHASWGMCGKVSGIGAKVDVNGTKKRSSSEISEAVSSFRSWLPGQGSSFYSASASYSASANCGLGTQIKDDKDTIEKMNREIEVLINGDPARGLEKLSVRVENCVEDVLAANSEPSERRDRRNQYVHKVFQNDSPLSGADNEFGGEGYLRRLRNGELDETRFLSWSGFSGGPSDVFRTGIDIWFQRSNEDMPTPNAVGLQRAYRPYSKYKGILFTEWDWWSTKSVGCVLTTEGWVHGSFSCKQDCAHSGREDSCSFHPPEEPYLLHRKHIMGTRFYGNMNCVWNDRYVGAKAKPLVLRNSYFGEAGTITVGLAKASHNPLAAIWGDGDTIRWSGILSAFNPFCLNTVVFSSAKAGYKRLGEEYDAGNLTREYCIDWDANQDWNLCQGDWDAVFVPVRMAQTMARDGDWEASKNDFLGEWVEKLIGSSESMRSGGTKRYNPTRDDPLDYRHYSRGWGRRPDYAKGLVVTEWQIEGKNKKPDWDRMTERMFH